jgi:hypothetical protein
MSRSYDTCHCWDDIVATSLQFLLRAFIFAFLLLSCFPTCCNASHTFIAVTCTFALLCLTSQSFKSTVTHRCCRTLLHYATYVSLCPLACSTVTSPCTHTNRSTLSAYFMSMRVLPCLLKFLRFKDLKAFGSPPFLSFLQLPRPQNASSGHLSYSGCVNYG